jgi:Leucine-rich repeat (LRR) protein
LNITGNPLIDVGLVFNSEMPSLQQLMMVCGDYYHNKTSKILGNEATINFMNLRSINCDFEFEKISISSTKMEKICFNGNRLNDINIASLKNLKFVRISQNNLTNLEFIFHKATNYENNIITDLDLNYNQIT